MDEETTVSLFERAMQEVRDTPHIEVKTCPTCREPKPRSEFRKNVSTSDGLQYDCVTCQNTRELSRKYGVAIETYIQMASAQGGRCLICGADGRRLHVDGKRLICADCNTGLGMFQHDPTIMANAIEYINRWRTPTNT